MDMPSIKSSVLSPIKVSHGTGKIEGIPSINTSPIGNAFCDIMKDSSLYVCRYCYARRMLAYRPSARACYVRNGDILSRAVVPMDALPTINATYARFHSFGELINETHLENFVRIARKNRKTTFSLWTKRRDLVQNYRLMHGPFPRNMILVYSEWNIDPVSVEIPRGFHKVFVVVTDEAKVNCSMKCAQCLKCYRLSRKKEDNYIYEYLRTTKKDKKELTWR